jgi:hypothetical protein
VLASVGAAFFVLVLTGILFGLMLLVVVGHGDHSWLAQVSEGLR